MTRKILEEVIGRKHIQKSMDHRSDLHDEKIDTVFKGRVLCECCPTVEDVLSVLLAIYFSLMADFVNPHYRAGCKILRRAKSPFWRPLSQRRLVYSLEYDLAAVAWIGMPIQTRDRQNHRFFPAVELCNRLYQFFAFDCVNDPIISLADSVAILDAGHLFTSLWHGIGR